MRCRSGEIALVMEALLIGLHCTAIFANRIITCDDLPPSSIGKGRKKVISRRLGSGSVEPYFQFIIDCVIRISGN
jgi:hypothetical protein